MRRVQLPSVFRDASLGPIVEALLERGYNVYSINPKQLDRFRDRFTVSGAKDDSLGSMCWRTVSGPTCHCTVS